MWRRFVVYDLIPALLWSGFLIASAALVALVISGFAAVTK